MEDVASPYRSDAAIAKNREAVLVQLKIAGDDDEAEEKVGDALAATAAAQKAHPDLRIAQFGDASAGKAISKSFEDDFKKAEITSLPITLLILLVRSAPWSPPACRCCWRSRPWPPRSA